MSTPSAHNLARVALYAGLLAGALDIAAAILLNLQVGPRVVLQSVATGWFGDAAYAGGWTTAGLGLASHFAIMLAFAVVFVAAAVVWPPVRRHWLAAGAVWGVAVWAVMTWVVVPLSASTLPAPDLPAAVQGLVVHVLAVGLPMAFVARRMLPPA